MRTCGVGKNVAQALSHINGKWAQSLSRGIGNSCQNKQLTVPTDLLVLFLVYPLLILLYPCTKLLIRIVTAALLIMEEG